MAKQNNDADVDFIRALAELLTANDLTELEVKREYGEADRLNVRVSRVQPIAPAPAPQAQAPAVVAPAAPAATAPAPNPSGDPSTNPDTVPSPMVGTVYLAPEPGAPAFVSIGDRVNAGQTLLIVEAMKTMNHIPAPRAGVVRRILVEDGAPVEFGAPLMIVE